MTNQTVPTQHFYMACQKGKPYSLRKPEERPVKPLAIGAKPEAAKIATASGVSAAATRESSAKDRSKSAPVKAPAPPSHPPPGKEHWGKGGPETAAWQGAGAPKRAQSAKGDRASAGDKPVANQRPQEMVPHMPEHKRFPLTYAAVGINRDRRKKPPRRPAQQLIGEVPGSKRKQTGGARPPPAKRAGGRSKPANERRELRRVLVEIMTYYGEWKENIFWEEDKFDAAAVYAFNCDVEQNDRL